ncbi:MAG: pilus assembly protein [Burkholderiales bacterium]|nr:MAG: pilus assembly protein [Burkholderiales bacterium]
MKRNITLFGRRQRGQGMTEYIIIVALIAVAAIAVFTFFGGTVRNQVAGMAKEISGQSASSNISDAKDRANDAETEGKKRKDMDEYTNN